MFLPAGASGSPAPPGVPTASITPVITGTLGTNGWYRSDVTLNWVLQPLPLSSSGCDAVTFVTDTPDAARMCTADFPGGIHIAVTVHIHRDATPPAVGAAPERPPDVNGWYSRALTVAFSGTDGTSGLASCISPQTYAGPDNPNAQVSGTCQDNAGNVGNAVLSFKYDGTPPTIGSLDLKPGNRSAQFSWAASPDTSTIALSRAPGVNGAAESVVFMGPGSVTTYLDRTLRPGRRYRYRLTAADVAGNQATRTVDFLARGALLFPAPGESVKKPPLLVWEPVRGASYYNVVLVRRRRVYSAWPVRPRLQLPRSWTYHGRRVRLRTGLYRWYVWPGFGLLSAGRYGRLLGGSTFVVSG